MKNLIAAVIASAFAVGAFAADVTQPAGDATKAPAASTSTSTHKSDASKKTADTKTQTQQHHKKTNTTKKADKPAA